MPNEMNNALSRAMSHKNLKERSQSKLGGYPKSSSNGTVTVMVWTIAGVVLAACGGGGGNILASFEIENRDRDPDSSTDTVRVVDGPVQGAAVYFDIDGDGEVSNGEREMQRDDGRPRYITDEEGKVDVPVSIPGTDSDSDYSRSAFVAVVDGAVDTSTGEVLHGEYRSLDDGRGGVASPLTDLLYEISEVGSGDVSETLASIFAAPTAREADLLETDEALITEADILNYQNYRIIDEPERPTQQTNEDNDEARQQNEAYLNDLNVYLITRAAIALAEIKRDPTLLDDLLEEGEDEPTSVHRTEALTLIFQDPAEITGDDLAVYNALNARIEAREAQGAEISAGKPVAAPDLYVNIDEGGGFTFDPNPETNRDEFLRTLFGFSDPGGNPDGVVVSAFRGVYIQTTFENGTLRREERNEDGELTGSTTEITQHINAAPGDDIDPIPETSVLNDLGEQGNDFYYIASGRLSEMQVEIDDDFAGVIEIEYFVYDGIAFSDKATLRINVTDVNDSPVFTGIGGNRGTDENPQYVISADGWIVNEDGENAGRINVTDIDDTIDVSNVQLTGDDAELFEIVNIEDDPLAAPDLYLRLRDDVTPRETGETYDITIAVEDDEPASESLNFTLTQGGFYVQPSGGLRTYSDGAGLLDEEVDGSATAIDIGEVGVEGLIMPNSVIGAPGDTNYRSAVTFSTTTAGFEINDRVLRYIGSDSGDYDISSRPSYELTITANWETSAGAQIEEHTYVVNLINLNDTQVAFTNPASGNASVTVDEDTTGVLYSARASDADGDSITYSLDAASESMGLFEIDSETGDVSLRADQSLDFETATSHQITILARSESDLEPIDPAVSPFQSAMITINVLDVNEAPEIRLINIAAITDARVAASSSAGFKVADILVTDDADNTHTFSRSGAQEDLFRVRNYDPATSRAELYYVGGANDALEAGATYDVTITARDQDDLLSNSFTPSIFQGGLFVTIPDPDSASDTIDVYSGDIINRLLPEQFDLTDGASYHDGITEIDVNGTPTRVHRVGILGDDSGSTRFILGDANGFDPLLHQETVDRFFIREEENGDYVLYFIGTGDGSSGDYDEEAGAGSTSLLITGEREESSVFVTDFTGWGNVQVDGSTAIGSGADIRTFAYSGGEVSLVGVGGVVDNGQVFTEVRITAGRIYDISKSDQPIGFDEVTLRYGTNDGYIIVDDADDDETYTVRFVENLPAGDNYYVLADVDGTEAGSELLLEGFRFVTQEDDDVTVNFTFEDVTGDDADTVITQTNNTINITVGVMDGAHDSYEDVVGAINARIGQGPMEDRITLLHEVSARTDDGRDPTNAVLSTLTLGTITGLQQNPTNLLAIPQFSEDDQNTAGGTRVEGDELVIEATTSRVYYYTISLDDVDDHGPALDIDSSVGLNGATITQASNGDVTITRDENGAVELAMIGATDPDEGDATGLRFSLDGENASLFQIHEMTGLLSFINASDANFEHDTVTGGVFSIEVIITSTSTLLDIRGQTPDARTVTIPVEVRLNDVNEAPTGVTLSQAALTPNSNVIGELSAIDVDAGDTHTFSIVDGPDAGRFRIVGNVLEFTQSERRALGEIYTIDIEARDQNGQGLTSEPQTFEIVVGGVTVFVSQTTIFSGDTNNRLLFENFDVSNNANGAIISDLDGDGVEDDPAFKIGRLGDTRSNVDDTVTFMIAPAPQDLPVNFTIIQDADGEYELYYIGNDTGDYDEETGEGTITASIISTVNGTPFPFEFVIHLRDIDDRTPAFDSFTPANDVDYDSETVALTLTENGEVNLGTITGIDPDDGDVVVYSLTPNVEHNDLFEIDLNSGALRFRDGENDFEHSDAINGTFTVRITMSSDSDNGDNFGEDVGARSATQNVTIRLTDINEAATGITISRAALVPGDDEVGILSAIDPDAGDTHRFTIVGGANADDFEIDNATGMLRFIGSTRLGAGQQYELEITATDQDGSGLTSTPQTLNIVEGGLYIAAGGAQVYTGDVSNRLLPEHLDLSSYTGTTAQVPDGSGGTQAGYRIGRLVDARSTTASFSLAETNNPNMDRFHIQHITTSGEYILYYIGRDDDAAPDYDEATNSGSISLRIVSRISNTDYEFEYVIHVENVDDVPPDPATLNITPSTNVTYDAGARRLTATENSADLQLGTVSASDPDGDTDITYQLFSGIEDNDLFEITSAGELSFRAGMNDREHSAASNGEFTIEIRMVSRSALVDTTGGTGESSASTQLVTVLLNDVNEAPTGVTLSNLVVLPDAARTVGTLTALDVDIGDTHQFTLGDTAEGFDNESFEIVGDELLIRTNAARKQPGDAYRVQVQATDLNGQGLSSDFVTFEITEGGVYILRAGLVGNLYSNYTDADGNGLLDENVSAGASAEDRVALGSIRSAFDTSYTVTIVEHVAGTNNNDEFSIENGMLYYIGSDSGDFEGTGVPSKRIDLEITHPSNDPITESYILRLADVNEAPTFDVDPELARVIEGNDFTLTQALLGIEDQDVGDDPSTLVISDTGSTMGMFIRNGVEVSEFTLQNVIDGEVFFRHSGGEQFEINSNGFRGSTETPTMIMLNVRDEDSASDDAQISFDVTEVEDAPTRTDDDNNDSSVDEGGAVNFQSGTIDNSGHINFTDVDSTRDDVIFVLVSLPQHGVLNLTENENPAVALNIGDTFMQGDLNVELVFYQHDGSETDTDSFTFRVVNRDGTDSETAVATNEDDGSEIFTHTINITGVNDVPIQITRDNMTADQQRDYDAAGMPAIGDNEVGMADLSEGEFYVLTVDDLGVFDSDTGAADITYTLVSIADTGGITLEVDGTDVAANGTFTLQQIIDREVRLNHDGTAPVATSLTYTFEDDESAASPPVTLTITPQAVNDNPTNIRFSHDTITPGPTGGTIVGTFTTSDEETSDQTAFEYDLVTATMGDARYFNIDERQLVFKSDNELSGLPVKSVGDSYRLFVRVEDDDGGFYLDEIVLPVVPSAEFDIDWEPTTEGVLEPDPVVQYDLADASGARNTLQIGEFIVEPATVTANDQFNVDTMIRIVNADGQTIATTNADDVTSNDFIIAGITAQAGDFIAGRGQKYTVSVDVNNLSDALAALADDQTLTVDFSLRVTHRAESALNDAVAYLSAARARFSIEFTGTESGAPFTNAGPALAMTNTSASATIGTNVNDLQIIAQEAGGSHSRENWLAGDSGTSLDDDAAENIDAYRRTEDGIGSVTRVVGRWAAADADAGASQLRIFVNDNEVELTANNGVYEGLYGALEFYQANGAGTAGRWRYVPRARAEEIAHDETVQEAFRVTIQDQYGASSNAITITARVVGRNDPPVDITGNIGAVAESGFRLDDGFDFEINAGNQNSLADPNRDFSTSDSATTNPLPTRRSSIDTQPERFNDVDSNDVAGTATASGTVQALDVDIIGSGGERDQADTHTFDIVETDNGNAPLNPSPSGSETITSREGTYGTLTLGRTTGAWEYVLDNTDADTIALDDGDEVEDRFWVRVTDNNNGRVWRPIVITVTGEGDSAILTHSNDGTIDLIVEDRGAGNSTNNTASGSLEMTRDDDGESAMLSIRALTSAEAAQYEADTDVTGNWITAPANTNISDTVDYGTLSFNGSTLAWTFTLDQNNADIIALDAGETLTQYIQFQYRQGESDTHSNVITVALTINGSNDRVAISHDAQQSVTVLVTEDDTSTLSVTRDITIDDPDASDTFATTTFRLGVTSSPDNADPTIIPNNHSSLTIVGPGLTPDPIAGDYGVFGFTLDETNSMLSWVYYVADQDTTAPANIAAMMTSDMRARVQNLKIYDASDNSGVVKDQLTVWAVDDSGAVNDMQTYATVEIRGVNDSPTLTISRTAVQFTDSPTSNAIIHNPSDLQGTFSADDVDSNTTTISVTGPSGSQADVSTLTDFTNQVTTAYLTLHYNESGGNYRFVLNPQAIDALATGTNQTIEFTVTARDDSGDASTEDSDPQTLTVTIFGNDETGTIVEDESADYFYDFAPDDYQTDPTVDLDII